MKTCSKCKLEKELTEFYKARMHKDGHSYKCKECDRAYKKANKEHYNKLELARYYRKREEIRAKARAKYVPQNNRKPSTPESIAASKKKWKMNNKHKINEYAMRRRAALLGRLPKDVDMDAIKAIYKEARLRREAGEDVHVDHIIPILGREMQGWHSPENLRIISASENLSKGNKVIPELVQLVITN